MSVPHTVLLPQVSPLASSPRRPRALTPDQVLEIRACYQRRVSTATLATRYGISRQTAHRVATGQIYTDVVSQPQIEWTDPTVRKRGVHSDDELRLMKAMMRQHVGRWALVKKTRTKPEGEPYDLWGLEVSAVKINLVEWGLYVRWAPSKAKVTVTAIAG